MYDCNRCSPYFEPANHEREAEIVAKAGSLGAITIATNMAGRGTDISLGAGDKKQEEKVKELILR